MSPAAMSNLRTRTNERRLAPDRVRRPELAGGRVVGLRGREMRVLDEGRASPNQSAPIHADASSALDLFRADSHPLESPQTAPPLVHPTDRSAKLVHFDSALRRFPGTLQRGACRRYRAGCYGIEGPWAPSPAARGCRVASRLATLPRIDLLQLAR